LRDRRSRNDERAKLSNHERAFLVQVFAGPAVSEHDWKECERTRTPAKTWVF
jgi:hypothetical protein